ncbi:hypothetical protein EQ818_18440, partial [Escherichia coli]
LWEKGSPLHKSTQQVRTQGPIRHADCRQRKLADFLCTGGIIQGLIRRVSVASDIYCLYRPYKLAHRAWQRHKRPSPTRC